MRGSRQVDLSSAAKRSVSESGGKQFEGSVRNEIRERVDSEVEGIFLASMESQEIRVERRMLLNMSSLAKM